MADGAPSAAPSEDHPHVAPREAWCGIMSGLTPLAVLVVCAAATIGLTVAARRLLAGSGFFAEQRAGVIVLVGGLTVSALLYAIAGIRALRQVAAWQRQSRAACAGGALCALGITAVIVALPVLLAVLLPQHPAP